MTTCKTWTKPALEVIALKNAKAGSFNVNDAQHTHKS